MTIPEWRVAGEAADFDAVVGEWDVVTNAGGVVVNHQLTVSEQNDVLTATMIDKAHGEIKVTAINYEDGILSYRIHTTKSAVTVGEETGREINSLHDELAQGDRRHFQRCIEQRSGYRIRLPG